MVDQLVIDILAYGHVLSAIAWLGGGIMTAFVLAPNLRSLSPGASLEFNAKILPKILRFVQIAIGTTLAFGILLFYVVAGQLTATQTNEIYGGMVLALVTAAIVFAVTAPSFRKVIRMSTGAMQSGQPPSPEMMKYGKRARLGSLVGAALLLVVLLTMIASGFS